MVSSSYLQETCDKPHCTESATKTYHGPNGNRLKLCGRHYYRLVKGGVGTPILPDQADLQKPARKDSVVRF